MTSIAPGTAAADRGRRRAGEHAGITPTRRRADGALCHAWPDAGSRRGDHLPVDPDCGHPPGPGSVMVWLPRPVYWLARKLVPIPCVDVLPYRDSDGGPEVGLIRRIGADGLTPGWALVGGRVMMRESLEEAVVRHVESTLGVRLEIGAIDTSRPLHAAEYSPDGRPGGRIDPNKHAVALSYVLEIQGPVTPMGEAVDFEWFPADAIPEQRAFAYSHGSVVAALIGTDTRLHRR